MLQFVEAKDVEKLFLKIEEINERTKNHTKQIKDLQRRVRELEK